jgi:hypothetical protein
VISYPQPAPAVTTVPASGLSTKGATLGAPLVDPSGADTVYRFQYWTSDPSSPTETQEGTVAADAGVRFVSVPVDGLQPETTYHYRLVASNSGGTTTGAEQAFATPADPLPPTRTPRSRFLALPRGPKSRTARPP